MGALSLFGLSVYFVDGLGADQYGHNNAWLAATYAPRVIGPTLDENIAGFQ